MDVQVVERVVPKMERILQGGARIAVNVTMAFSFPGTYGCGLLIE